MWWAFVIGLLSAVAATSQETRPAGGDSDHHAQFARRLSGAKLSGHFTITGKDLKDLTAEEYHIHEVKKMDEGDYWMFKARVKYGGRDVTVPMPLEVKWAEKTPVITLDNVEIPLLGTFSARVVIDGDRYAGTWSHGDVGGHLFGRIDAGQAAEEPAGDSDK
jgi:hypothetical protein